jgi:hypothetical protein
MSEPTAAQAAPANQNGRQEGEGTVRKILGIVQVRLPIF